MKMRCVSWCPEDTRIRNLIVMRFNRYATYRLGAVLRYAVRRRAVLCGIVLQAQYWYGMWALRP